MYYFSTKHGSKKLIHRVDCYFSNIFIFKIWSFEAPSFVVRPGKADTKDTKGHEGKDAQQNFRTPKYVAAEISEKLTKWIR